MSQPTRILHFLQTTVIVIVAAVYCLAPLQKPLADGFHKLEHSILNSSANHSHDDAHQQHVHHEHQMLSFFNDLFAEDPERDHPTIKDIILDKHVLPHYTSEQKIFEIAPKKEFSYHCTPYGIYLPNILPPPEGLFS